jgi:hypothetical protein
MTTDEKITLAEVLANELIGVERTEFEKWVEYIKAKQSLDRALKLANYLSSTPMLRSRPRRSYRRIYSVIVRRKDQLLRLSINDLLEIFGYVERVLIGKFAKPISGALKGVRVTEKEISKIRGKYDFRRSRK